MMSLQAEGFYDPTFLCIDIPGAVLLAGYVGFAYAVTNRGDFYHRRRWKAAIWFASIPTIIASSILVYLATAAGLLERAEDRRARDDDAREHDPAREQTLDVHTLVVARLDEETHGPLPLPSGGLSLPDGLFPAANGGVTRGAERVRGAVRRGRFARRDTRRRAAGSPTASSTRRTARRGSSRAWRWVFCMMCRLSRWRCLSSRWRSRRWPLGLCCAARLRRPAAPRRRDGRPGLFGGRPRRGGVSGSTSGAGCHRVGCRRSGLRSAASAPCRK